MRLVIYSLALVFIVSACNQSSKSQTAVPVSHVDYISSRTIRLMNLFKCDSLNTRYHTLHAYFSHSKPNFDELQTEQFTHYALALIEFDVSQVDTLVYHYSSKRVNVSQKSIIETYDNFYKQRVMYNSLKMQPILNKIFLYERESEENNFLNDLNTDFAVAKYGEEISKRAIIGIDAIEIIYKYIGENENEVIGENSAIIENYKKGVTSKKDENKEMHEKLIKAIHTAVEK